MADKFDIKKLTSSLTGKERAKLYIRDFHERECEKKTGFLTPAESQSLLLHSHYNTKDEFDAYLNLYRKAPDVWFSFMNSFECFNLIYGNFDEVRFLLKMSRGLRYATDFISNAVISSIRTEDEYKKMQEENKDDDLDWTCYLIAKGGKEDELTQVRDGEMDLKRSLKRIVKFLETSQVVQIKERSLGKPDKVAFKEDVGNFIKATSRELHNEACRMFTLMAIMQKINQELGFNVFSWLDTPISARNVLDVVNYSIKKYNDAIYEAIRDECQEFIAKMLKKDIGKCYKELEGLENYIIKDLTPNIKLYGKWETILFKGLSS